MLLCHRAVRKDKHERRQFRRPEYAFSAVRKDKHGKAWRKARYQMPDKTAAGHLEHPCFLHRAGSMLSVGIPLYVKSFLLIHFLWLCGHCGYTVTQLVQETDLDDIMSHETQVSYRILSYPIHLSIYLSIYSFILPIYSFYQSIFLSFFSFLSFFLSFFLTYFLIYLSFLSIYLSYLSI